MKVFRNSKEITIEKDNEIQIGDVIKLDGNDGEDQLFKSMLTVNSQRYFNSFDENGVECFEVLAIEEDDDEGEKLIEENKLEQLFFTNNNSYISEQYKVLQRYMRGSGSIDLIDSIDKKFIKETDLEYADRIQDTLSKSLKDMSCASLDVSKIASNIFPRIDIIKRIVENKSFNNKTKKKLYKLILEIVKHLKTIYPFNVRSILIEEIEKDEAYFTEKVK